MNRHELKGGARYVGGRIETAVGGAVNRRDWQVDGVIDQVAGGAEHLYGRARAAAPGLAERAAGRIGDTARTMSRALRDAPAAGAAGVVGGYLFARLLHRRRD